MREPTAFAKTTIKVPKGFGSLMAAIVLASFSLDLEFMQTPF